MTDSLSRRILETIRQHRMTRPGDRVAVAVSGGADSVALLLLLEEVRPHLGINLLAVHFNHKLRGRGSDEDEEFVRQLASSHGMELISAREDVAAEAERMRANLEETARERRYRFFARLVAEGKAGRVAVAHTADDQAETILGRLGRGTGLLGLAGIYPVLGSIIRPLLRIRRQELRAYLQHAGQPWRDDPSNEDTTKLRARIRKEVLPLLEQRLSPALVTHLGWLAELARGEEAFWAPLIDERMRALVQGGAEGHSIAVEDLLAPFSLPGAPAGLKTHPEAQRAVTRRLIRRIFEQVKRGHGQLSAEHVEQVIRLASASSSGRRVRLPGGAIAERRFDRLVFAPAEGQAQAQPGAYAYAVEIPASGELEIEIAEIGKRFRLNLIDWSGPARDTKQAEEALDADLLPSPLVLRGWQQGDAYRPAGRKRARKLKRLLLDERIPAPDRRGWPVLTSQGRLVWAWCLPPAAEFVAGSGSRKGLVIREAREGGTTRERRKHPQEAPRTELERQGMHLISEGSTE
jgi:tRNA(Ile)-lysidine synthase